MRTLALRVLAFFVLLAVAHSVKPFTRDNLVAFTRASVSSLAEGLPASGFVPGKKTALLVSVISQLWQENDARSTTSGSSMSLLAANLPATQQGELTPGRCCKARSRTYPQRQDGWRTIRENFPELKEVEASDETLVSDELSLPGNTIEEMPAELPAKEAIALPAVPVWGKVLSAPAAKRDACEIPPQNAEPMLPLNEIAPEAKSAEEEEQTIQSVKPLRGLHSNSPFEIEVQPVAFPLSSPTKMRFRVDLKQARKAAAKC